MSARVNHLPDPSLSHVRRSPRLDRKKRLANKKELDGLLLNLRRQELGTPSEATTGEACPAESGVDHPAHYTSHPSGVECIEIAEHFGFNIGNAMKYLWRSGLKSPDPKEDLEKALWYINRELERLGKAGGK